LPRGTGGGVPAGLVVLLLEVSAGDEGLVEIRRVVYHCGDYQPAIAIRFSGDHLQRTAAHGASAAAADDIPRGLQGQSQASWDIIGGGRGGPVRGGSLKVVTTKLKAGYLRKNGVPYSDKTVLTEYYDRTNEPNGDSWLVVTTVVDDPTYLNQPFI